MTLSKLPSWTCDPMPYPFPYQPALSQLRHYLTLPEPPSLHCPPPGGSVRVLFVLDAGKPALGIGTSVLLGRKRRKKITVPGMLLGTSTLVLAKYQ